jgi:hypothetical protein
LFARTPAGERPERPFTGYKLARAILSADGTRAGFAGLTLGADQVYGAVDDAGCVWNARHAPPRKWCGCGFYCLHALADAQALGCATEHRSALLIEVSASGRYIRYERGLRYSRQRVRVIRESHCECGRPGAMLADAGTGLIGWRHLAPVCGHCAAGRAPILTLAEFAARTGGSITVAVPAGTTSQGTGSAGTGPAGTGSPVAGSGSGAAGPDSAGAGSPQRSSLDERPLPEGAGESPIAVLGAEIALLHARLDDIQARLDGLAEVSRPNLRQTANS